MALSVDTKGKILNLLVLPPALIASWPIIVVAVAVGHLLLPILQWIGWIAPTRCFNVLKFFGAAMGAAFAILLKEYLGRLIDVPLSEKDRETWREICRISSLAFGVDVQP